MSKIKKEEGFSPLSNHSELHLQLKQNSDTNKQIANRVTLLNRAKDAYYNGSKSLLLDDAAFDRLEEELRQWAPDDPYFYTVGSPIRLQENRATELAAGKICHAVPMLSMDKAKQVSALIAWFERLRKACGLLEPSSPLCIQPKIDGISASCYYQNGKLAYVATRGDGQYGQNISHISPMLADIPVELPQQGEHDAASLTNFEVRGELYVPKNLNLVNDGFPLGPLRNICAGLINRKEVKPEDLQQLRFVAYQCPQQRLHSSEYEQVLLLEQMGFHTVDTKRCTIQDVEVYVKEYLSKLRQSWCYETDGLIICIDDSRLFTAIDALWVVSHHHHYAIALKPPAESGFTLLRQIHWQLGRQGRLNPVAEFLPIVLASAIIERATLHNYTNVLRLQAQRGDILEVERAGDVIPYVRRNLGSPSQLLQAGSMQNLNCAAESITSRKGGQAVNNSTKHGAESEASRPLSIAKASEFREQLLREHGADLIPAACPSCQGPVQRKGVDLFCSNHNCPEQVVQRILFWVKQAEMDQVAEQSIRQLYREGKLRQLQDLYCLTKQEFSTIPGYGDKKIHNFMQQLENSRNLSVTQFIERLGIPSMQQKSAQKLGELRRRSRWELFLARSYDLCPLWQKPSSGKQVVPRHRAESTTGIATVQNVELLSLGSSGQAELAGEAENEQALLLQAMSFACKELLADWQPRNIAAEPPHADFCQDLLKKLLQQLAVENTDQSKAWPHLLRLWASKTGRNTLWKNGFAVWQELLLKKGQPKYLDLYYIEDFTAFSEPPSRYSVIEELQLWLAQEQNQVLLRELLEVLQIERPKEDLQENFGDEARPQTSARLVCMTGSGPKPRKELQAQLEAAGYSVSSTLNKDTGILLCADPHASSSKLQKARSWGVQLVSYDEFFAEGEKLPVK